jgi:glycosyltransferase 2 family protein
VSPIRTFYREHRQALNILFKYGIGVGLLVYVIVDNWSGLGVVFSRPLRVWPLVLATGIATVGLLITFLRWHFLVRAIGMPFSRYNAIRLGLVGYFFNTFLPGAIGGDIVKGYAISREHDRRTLAVATVLIDRIIGLWALIWFVAIIGSVFLILDDPILKNPELRAIVVFSLIFVAASMSIWIVLGFLSENRANRFAERLEKVRKVGGSLAELWRACWMYRKRSRAVLIAMLMSLVGHICWVLVFHFSVQAFEAPNPETDIGTLPEHMLVVPVGMTVSAIILVPGGIGVGEKAYEELYRFLGKPKENGVAGCLSQRVIFFGLGLLGYIVYTRMRAGISRTDRPPVEPVAASPPEAMGHPSNPGVAMRPELERQ